MGDSQKDGVSGRRWYKLHCDVFLTDSQIEAFEERALLLVFVQGGATAYGANLELVLVDAEEDG